MNTTFVFLNRLRLLFTILFKLSFKSIFNHSSFSKSIIANKTYFSFVKKTSSSRRQFQLSLCYRVSLIKFSAKLTTCHDFFHFIFDKIEDFFKIF